MGWCSATVIMDAAIEAAERAVAQAWQTASGNGGARFPAYATALGANPALRDDLDDVLRPFVKTIAEKLMDGDWDCQTDSDYFSRFPREMLGMDDHEYAQYLRDQED